MTGPSVFLSSQKENAIRGGQRVASAYRQVQLWANQSTPFSWVARTGAWTTTNTQSIFTFDTIVDDNFGMYSTANSVWNITYPGTYLLNFYLRASNSAVGQWIECDCLGDNFTTIQRGQLSVPGAIGGLLSANISFTFHNMAAGQQIRAYQFSSTAGLTGVAGHPELVWAQLQLLWNV